MSFTKTLTVQYIEALHKLKNVVTSPENLSDIQSGTGINAFHGTEIIALLFDKTKEEVMNDYLNLFKKEVYNVQTMWNELVKIRDTDHKAMIRNQASIYLLNLHADSDKFKREIASFIEDNI